MDSKQAGRYWDGNAEAWTVLSRAGYDTYRDHLNTPAFFEMLPDVHGLRGLDIGCGEGYNTRLLVERGASVTAIDISETFIRHARATEDAEPRGIDYHLADACALPFDADAFDFAVAFMSLMDMPKPEDAIRKACRVVRPGGFLQFSISHPCYDTPHRINLRDVGGTTYAIEIGDYFKNQNGEIIGWLFSAAPPEERARHDRFKVPRFTRTLSQWLNMLLDTGFAIERIDEPKPSNDVVRQYPNVQDAQVVAYFLHVRARKAAA